MIHVTNTPVILYLFQLFCTNFCKIILFSSRLFSVLRRDVILDIPNFDEGLVTSRFTLGETFGRDIHNAKIRGASDRII